MWQAQAVSVLGAEHALARMVSAALHPAPRPQRQVTAAWVRETAAELLGGIVSRDGAASSALSVRAVAAWPEAQLQDAVARYADTVAYAPSRLRVSLDEAPA